MKSLTDLAGNSNQEPGIGRTLQAALPPSALLRASAVHNITAPETRTAEGATESQSKVARLMYNECPPSGFLAGITQKYPFQQFQAEEYLSCQGAASLNNKAWAAYSL